MTISRRSLCVFYALAAAIALVGTWGNNAHYLGRGLVGANVAFWQETLANPASRSITVDILSLGLAAIVWMLLEARRLAMRGIWIYVFLGIFVAMGAAFPMFLIHRERALAARDGSTGAGTLPLPEVLAVAAVGVAFAAYTFVALAP